MTRLLGVLAVALALASPPARSEDGIRIASAGLHAVNMAPDLAEFYANHLAQQLELAGIRVITPSEVATMIGIERQKQLLGCSGGTSCLVELGNALGADGVLTGDLARLDASFHVNIKVLGARDGQLLSLYTGEADGERALLDELTRAARRIAPELGTGLHKKVEARAVATETPRNVIGLNIGSPLLGVYQAEYERMLTDRWSILAETTLTLNRVAILQGGQRENGLGVGLGFTFHPWATAPQGWFVGAKGDIMMMLFTEAGTTSGGFATLAFGGGGYTFQFWNRFLLSLGVWAGIEVDFHVGATVTRTVSRTGQLRLEAGYRF